jgi:hypothetical protein
MGILLVKNLSSEKLSGLLKVILVKSAKEFL